MKPNALTRLETTQKNAPNTPENKQAWHQLHAWLTDTVAPTTSPQTARFLTTTSYDFHDHEKHTNPSSHNYFKNLRSQWGQKLATWLPEDTYTLLASPTPNPQYLKHLLLQATLTMHAHQGTLTQTPPGITPPPPPAPNTSPNLATMEHELNYIIDTTIPALINHRTHTLNPANYHHLITALNDPTHPQHTQLIQYITTRTLQNYPQ